MKTTILTLNGYRNYGNRLQLFALTRVLRSLGVKNSIYWPKTRIECIKDGIRFHTLARLYFRKDNKIRNFVTNNIPDKIATTVEPVSIVGSDQVWNPDYLKNNPHLLNVPGEGKKISYAASMGVSELTEEQEEMFRKALKNYSAISVREQSAKDLLQPLTDKPIKVVLDPTLLLNKTEYVALEKCPNNIKPDEKYVLCYILGDRDHEAAIERFAREKGYKTIYFSDKRDSSYGVEEFLYLIHHAQLICTDSFHACVFSFIFERPFVAFRRSGEADYMYTRLRNLIDIFRLKDREYDGKEITERNQMADYSDAKKVLKKEQEKAINFLKNALDIKG